MFSTAEKQKLSAVVESAIRELNHPEMDNENIKFKLHIDGRESWSWADIHENSKEVGTPNPWNEVSRKVLEGK